MHFNTALVKHRFEIYAEEHWIYEDLHSVIEPPFETFPNGEQNSSSLLMQILRCVLRQCWQFCPSCVSPIGDINRNIQQYDSRGGFCVFVIVWVAMGGYSTPGMVAFMYVVFVSNTVFVFIFVFLFVKRCCLSSVSSIQLPTALLLPPIVFIQHNAICLRWNHHSFVFFFTCISFCICIYSTLWNLSLMTPSLMDIWWLQPVFACGDDVITPNLMRLILESIKSSWRQIIAFWCCFENIF